MLATIQARAEYRSRFDSFYYRVEIVDSHNDTQNIRDLEITPEGAVITYEQKDEDLYQPIIPSSCTINLVCQTTADISFLRHVARAESGRYGIRIQRNTSDSFGFVYWVGTILSDQLQFSDSTPQIVQITATDDLGYLKEQPYLLDNGARFSGVASITEHILNCLKHTRTSTWWYEYFITVLGSDFFNPCLSFSEDIIPQSFVSSGGGISRFFDESRIQHVTFYDDDDGKKAIDCYKVLEDIMLFYNCQIYQTYNQQYLTFCVQPVGALQKFADDGSAVSNGQFRRTDNTTYTTFQNNLHTIACSNDGSDKPRTAGGVFNYLQPYRKLSRTDVHASGLSAYNKEFSELGTGPEIPFEIETTISEQLFPEGEVYLLKVRASAFWQGEQSGNTVQYIWENAHPSSSFVDTNATAPEHFNIMRIFAELQFRLSNAGGNDYYLKRHLTTGGQAPVYSDYEGFTSVPQYYTDLYSNENITWDNSGDGSTRVQIISEPFDGRQTQLITIEEVFLLPAIPDFATDSDFEGQKFEMDINVLSSNNTKLIESAAFQQSFLFEIDNMNPSGRFDLYMHEDFQNYENVTYTVVNDIDARKSKTCLSPERIGDMHAGFQGAVHYRHGSGAYQPEVIGYNNLAEASTDVWPAAKLCAQEIASYYSRHREKYNGNLIKQDASLASILTIKHGLMGGGTETVKYKLQQLTAITGFEECNITCIELKRDKVFTEVQQTKGPKGDDTTKPPIILDAVSTVKSNNASGLLSTFATKTAPTNNALNTMVNVDRTSQTGVVLPTINLKSELIDLADGSANQYLKTNGSGVLSWSALTSDGWHGSTTLIKVLPTEFMANDDGGAAVIEDDTADKLAVKTSNRFTEFYVTKAIPTGYKATHVQVYASASTSSGVTVRQFDQTDGDLTGSTTGDFNSNIDITDINSSATANIMIKCVGSTTVVIYGADITITTI
tara:strand:+ start:94 stop:2946 length:2853 start_codon:yes stop_codon:yes gene_type:complete